MQLEGSHALRSRARTALPTWCVLGASLFWSQCLHAQARPDAGQILEGIRPPPTVPNQGPGAALPQEEAPPAVDESSSQFVLVQHWRITGAHVFPVAQLEALVNEFRGQKLKLAELSAAARRITIYYRKHGYLLSRAYVPAQKVKNDTVEIAVIEGRLGSIEVSNNSAVAASLVTRDLAQLRSTGPVEGHSLERSLLLLNDLPGVEVRSTLKPGASVGASDLDVQLNRTDRLSGSVDADDFGNRYTGQFRGGGTLNFNEPFHYGDVLSLRGESAGSGMNYGRLAYQIPMGGDGFKSGIAVSDLHYKLGEQFKSLGAEGTAEVGTLWTAYQIVRNPWQNLAVQLSYDHKRLEDLINSTDTDSHKSLDVLTLGLSGDWTDGVGGVGVNVYSADLTSGRLGLDPTTAAVDQGQYGHHTRGEYFKVSWSYSRTQSLTHRLSLYTSLTGQASSKNLDTSETLALGGVYGVRAYPQDEGAGDDAAILNLELRWTVPGLSDMQLLTFADAGTVRINHTPLPTDTDNRRTLKGEGLGLQWMGAKRFALRAYLAWRAGPVPQTDIDRRPRGWLQFVQYF
jgi:hemolysin activation/secretion protein